MKIMLTIDVGYKLGTAVDEGTAVIHKLCKDNHVLGELFYFIQDKLQVRVQGLLKSDPIYRDFRAGDVRHSQADISKAEKLLGFQPTHVIDQGLEEAMDWYVKDLT